MLARSLGPKGHGAGQDTNFTATTAGSMSAAAIDARDLVGSASRRTTGVLPVTMPGWCGRPPSPGLRGLRCASCGRALLARLPPRNAWKATRRSRERFWESPGANLRPWAAAAPAAITSTMQAGDTVLVTGVSGFLGSAVARALIARGLRVRALVRRTSPRGNLAGLDCEVVAGDLIDRSSLAAAVRGQRYLFHVAADYRFWAPDPQAIVRTNVEGTRNLMCEALAAGVERIVYTSSVAALRSSPAPTALSTRRRRSPPHEAIGAYKRSKTAGRAPGRGHGRRRRPARRHRQPLDADRPARHPADADRTHPARCGTRADAGLRRHRAELRPCRRHRRGPSARLREGPHRRALHPGRRERLPARPACERRRASAAAGRRGSACRAVRSIPWPSAPKRSRASPARSRC